MKIYIGTYTEGFLSDRDTGSKGIYSCELDEKSGKISILDGTMCRNPSFVTLSPDKKCFSR